MSIINSEPSAARGKAIKDLITSSISNSYDGDARGMLAFPHTYGGHYISWIKEGDVIKFYDGQNPKADIDTLFSYYKYYRNSIEGGLTSIRLDDLEPTNEIYGVIGRAGANIGRGQFNLYRNIGKNFVMKYL